MDAKQAYRVVIEEFLQIASIPRPSHHEEAIGDYLFQWALNRHLAVQRDELGNLIIEKAATAGCETSPRVILQAHMDMVCVAAEGVSYDSLKDPIRVVNNGKALSAEGTSLGADDGIGIAICLYFLQDQTLKHGPLRVIITVNEEDGMSSGAMNPKYLDADYLINLDWEWLGSLCNSSAGGDFFSLSKKFTRKKASAESVAMQLRLSGLLGGHSGVDINRGRLNALLGIATALHALEKANIPFELSDFHGGQARNAIPSSAEAALWVSKNHLSAAEKVLADYGSGLRHSFESVESHLSFSFESAGQISDNVIPSDAVTDLLKMLTVLPSGVHTMSPFVPGLVESSQNIGLLTMDDHTMTIASMQRSCSHFRAVEIQRISSVAATLCGFAYQAGEHTPAWAVNPVSRLTALACEEYLSLTGKQMVVEPVHGGLECGAFFEMNPNLDMIAIGPTLCDVHSPKETCDLESVDITTQLVARLLEKLL